MIKLMPLVEQIHQKQLEEVGVKDIALGAAMAASSIFGGAKAQSKIPTDKPAITQQASVGNINPKFWVQTTDKETNPDIQKIQQVIKAYRLYTIERWKLGDKSQITMGKDTMNYKNPEDIKRVESNFMLWCLGTGEDGKNGFYTSQFEFPTAFLRDVNKGTMENLGLAGNDILTLINNSSITVKQMAEWNNYVKWMKDKGYAGDKRMNQADFRNEVLKEYKGEK